MPTAPTDPGLFGWNPSFDYGIGDTIFQWDLDTAVDRLFGRDGADLGDAAGAAGDMAGAAGSAATAGVLAAIEPWVGRVVAILIALIFIAGGIALLSSGKPVQVMKEALA